MDRRHQSAVECGGEGSGSSLADAAYPLAFRELEEQLVRRRRERAELPLGNFPTDGIGLALSGGGIRSATFNLGVLQALARADLLRRVDILSTVSGGGYIGAFLGRLFTRPYIESPLPPPKEPNGTGRHDFDALSSHARVSSILTDPHSMQLAFLRDNGRYLSPNGGGDNLLAGTAIIRNGVAVNVVMATMLLTLFLALGLVRVLTVDHLPAWCPRLHAVDLGRLWLSDYLLLPLALAAVIAVPIGFGYWLTRLRDALWVIGLLALSLTILPAALHLGVPLPLLLLVCWWLVAGVTTTALANRAAVRRSQLRETQAHFRNTLLTQVLEIALVLVAITLVFGVIDSLGQSLFVVVAASSRRSAALLATVPSTGALLAAGQKLVSLIDARDKRKRLSIPTGLIAIAAALFILSVIVVVASSVAHGIEWGWRPPTSRVADAEGASQSLGAIQLRTGGAEVLIRGWDSFDAPRAAFSNDPQRQARLSLAVLAAVALTVAIGRTISFLNRSSLYALYTARLTRAYLGASNPRRWEKSGMRLSDVIDDDGIGFDNYCPHRAGGPLHILNVTLNETVNGKTQVEYRDDKGLSLAVGPVGMSAGVRHHAAWHAGDQHSRRLAPVSPDANQFRIFDPGRYEYIKAEALDLGQWVAISGAAVSTGLGARTSLGLSLLCGLANVRLGYWWDSGIAPMWRTDEGARPSFVSRVGQVVGQVQPVYKHLIDEFLARFPGPANERWYLTDGGHFENTAAYELIRRRLPLIIIADCGADPDYTYADLGNLIRKARVDFGTHIAFMGERDHLGQLVRAPDKLRDAVGTLGDLRLAAVTSKNLDPFLPRPLATHRVAYARVDYPTGHTGTLLLVKPTLTGIEPFDVRQYWEGHPAFPQESTAEQYFDEAQWESYRALGQCAGIELVSAIRSTLRPDGA